MVSDGEETVVVFGTDPDAFSGFLACALQPMECAWK